MRTDSRGWKKRYAAAARKLKGEVLQRKAAQKALKTTKKHYEQLLKELHGKQEHLRDLSRQILIAQEEDRKKISRELHDEIAQNLSGINMYLATLRAAATENTRGLKNKIVRAERLVEKSVVKVHRLARTLRPSLLDDLGLIPALRSYAASFTKRTGVPIHLNVFRGVERLSTTQRTVLYRVAQSALMNVAKHAHASLVKVDIQRNHRFIDMEISDNGKSFNVERMLLSNRKKRLGFLGMRERVEIVGGELTVASVRGTGTTLGVRIPVRGPRSAAK